MVTASPARIQSAGALNTAPIIMTTGRGGGRGPRNHVGGRYTYCWRGVKPLPAAGMVTATTTPDTGTGAPDPRVGNAATATCSVTGAPVACW